MFSICCVIWSLYCFSCCFSSVNSVSPACVISFSLVACWFVGSRQCKANQRKAKANASQCKAKPGNAKQGDGKSKAMQSKTMESKAMQSNGSQGKGRGRGNEKQSNAVQSNAMWCNARHRQFQSSATRSKAMQSNAKQRKAKQCKPRLQQRHRQTVTCDSSFFSFALHLRVLSLGPEFCHFPSSSVVRKPPNWGRAGLI